MIDENYQAALGAQARAFNAFLDAIMPLPFSASDAPTPEPVDPGRQPGSEPEMTPPPPPEPESPAAEEPPAEEPTP